VAPQPLIDGPSFITPGSSFSVNFNGRDGHGRTMMYSMNSCNTSVYYLPVYPSVNYFSNPGDHWVCAFHATAVGDHGDVHTTNRLTLPAGLSPPGFPPVAALSLSDVVGHASPESPFVAHVKNISFDLTGHPLTHTRILCTGGEGSVAEELETDCSWT